MATAGVTIAGTGDKESRCGAVPLDRGRRPPSASVLSAVEESDRGSDAVEGDRPTTYNSHGCPSPLLTPFWYCPSEGQKNRATSFHFSRTCCAGAMSLANGCW